MSEPLIDRLQAFTPIAGSIDRDARFFAAGKASVRSRPTWAVITGVLAASQLVTLALLWPQPTVIERPLALPPMHPAIERPPAEAPADAAVPRPAVHDPALAHELKEVDEQLLLDSVVPPDPPLRATLAALPQWLN